MNAGSLQKLHSCVGLVSFLFVCVCSRARVRSQKRTLELEFQAIVSHLVWVLGTKLQPLVLVDFLCLFVC